MNTQEDNKLIAEFMGGEFTIESDVLGWAIDKSKPMTTYEAVKLPLETLPSSYKHGTIMLSHLFYHTSWDWLMPVVESIFERLDSRDDSANEIKKGMLVCSRNNTYKAVVEFIKQYNK